MKKVYKIPVSWEMCGYVTVNAESAKEAFQIAEDNQDDYSLPSDGCYIDSSFKIEHDNIPFKVHEDGSQSPVFLM